MKGPCTLLFGNVGRTRRVDFTHIPHSAGKGEAHPWPQAADSTPGLTGRVRAGGGALGDVFDSVSV